MNYLFKFKPLFLLCVILQACNTADKAATDKADGEKITSATPDQTKKKGIVLIDDNGKLGDLFKSGAPVGRIKTNNGKVKINFYSDFSQLKYVFAEIEKNEINQNNSFTNSNAKAS